MTDSLCYESEVFYHGLLVEPFDYTREECIPLYVAHPPGVDTLYETRETEPEISNGNAWVIRFEGEKRSEDGLS